MLLFKNKIKFFVFKIISYFRLCDEITKTLIQNSNLEVEDLVDWLIDVFDDNFDLILEDGSIEPAARSLIDTVKSIKERFNIK